MTDEKENTDELRAGESTMSAEMGKIFDEIEARSDEVEAVEAPEESEVAPAEEIEQEDVSPDSDDDPEHVEEDAEQPDGADAVVAPDHWSAEARERFEAITDTEARRMVLDTRKSLERGYDRKFQDLAEERRQIAEWDSVFAPVEESLKLAGVNRTQAVQRLLAAQQMLERNPRQGIAYLAQQYGVDTTQPVQGEPVDPQIAGLQAELHGVKSLIQQQHEAEQRAKLSAVEKQIEDFRSATGDDGKPMYPHFEKVQGVMARLADVNPDADLPTLYEQAVYADPTTRAEVLAAEQRKVQDALAKEAKQKSAKARKATTPQGAAAGKATVKGATMRESMELAYDKAVSGS